jgi:hypothetical protein
MDRKERMFYHIPFYHGVEPWSQPERFPCQLHDLLEKQKKHGCKDILSWLPCGTAFKIHNKMVFEQVVMPVFFPGMTCYKSFRRQLNLYNIHQNRGKEVRSDERYIIKKRSLLTTSFVQFLTGAYFHPLFVQDRRDLCAYILRKPRKKKVLVEFDKLEIPQLREKSTAAVDYVRSKDHDANSVTVHMPGDETDSINWVRAHDVSLLEFAYQASNFSRGGCRDHTQPRVEDIAEEIILTFGDLITSESNRFEGTILIKRQK